MLTGELVEGHQPVPVIIQSLNGFGRHALELSPKLFA
jgi:hypothetical protein